MTIPSRRAALPALAMLAIASASTGAGADTATDLRLKKFPTMTPSSLSMRVAQTQVDGNGDAPAPAPREAGEELPLDPEVGEDALELEIEASLRERVRASDALGERRRLDEKVVLQVSLGVGVDGGQPAPPPATLASGAALNETTDYARLRSYGFGDVVIGTNGLGTSSLRSYFATGYRFLSSTSRSSTAVPSVYDGDFGAFVVRSAWVDVEEVFETPILRPLYLRVGRQYKYGAAIAHFTGITAGYATRGLRVSAFSGTRAEPYDFHLEAESNGGNQIAGADLSLDLYDLRRIPLVVTASALRFDGRSHIDGSAALRLGRNSLLRGHVRTLGSSLAQETVRLRARLTEVTTISAEVDNRHAGDWAYDLLLVRPETEQTDPRSYLNLGPPRPRLRSAVRAGTVLLRNVDLLASLAGAIDYASEEEFPATATRPSYLEAGSAIELQARRGLRIGVSGTGRVYRRPPDERAADLDGVADPLAATNGGVGETSFIEGGVTLRYSLGARIFSAQAEAYGRRFRFQSPYNDDELPVADLRTGGRVSIDGWASSSVRFRLSYDLSLTEIRYAPELAGVKTLRAMVEGTF